MINRKTVLLAIGIIALVTLVQLSFRVNRDAQISHENRDNIHVNRDESMQVDKDLDIDEDDDTDSVNLNNNDKSIESKTPPQTIFVSMAAYRDALCSDTLNYLFLNAEHPENVFVGLIDQGADLLDPQEPEEEGYPNSFCYRKLKVPASLIRSNVRYLSLKRSESKGPTYARYLATTLYKNETYFMQIDSHIRFIKGWDTSAISELFMTKSKSSLGKYDIPRSVLTYYPMAYNASIDGLPKEDHSQVPRLCKGDFNGKGIITFNSYIFKPGKEPLECPYIAAGFFFTTGEALDLVPFDPYLPNLFEGEEILYSVRMWTAGFRFFGPTINLCYHYYTRKGSPKFWEDDHQYGTDMVKSMDKVKFILGWNTTRVDTSGPIYKDIEKYSIHDKNLLEEYYKRYHINVKDKKVDYSFWCK
ncbi:hypothetical protein CYY_006245 [Polysphondylium violaceum]|uniref:GlcNAc transferase n=1 Tax=Polysphondylium violaceum TaxID=133409 RepID=A0A8J4UZ38_9MYCE|nr:hypothetical protein CYY_006245 [Polysphondylium violaceum]